MRGILLIGGMLAFVFVWLLGKVTDWLAEIARRPWRDRGEDET